MSQSSINFTENGPVVPDTATVRDAVEQDWQAAFDMVKASPAVPLQLVFLPLVLPGSADVFYSQEVSDN